MGQNYLSALGRLTGAGLVAVCDPDRAARERACSRVPQARPYADLHACLADPAVEGCIVATPPATHYPLTRAVLAAGRHALVEKPFTLRAAHARDLLRTARRRGLVLMAGHLLEYHPATEAARRLLRGLQPPYFVRGLRAGPRPRHHHSVLWDLLVHDLSRLRYLVRRTPAALSAVGAHTSSIALTVAFRGEVSVHLTASWVTSEPARRLELYGPGYSLTLDELLPRPAVALTYRTAAGTTVTAVKETPGNALARQCAHFVRRVRDGRQPRTGAHDIRWVMSALQAAECSLAARGRWVLWPGGCSWSVGA